MTLNAKLGENAVYVIDKILAVEQSTHNKEFKL